VSDVDPATGLPDGYPLDPDWEITPVGLHDARTRGQAPALLDCRTPAEHETAAIDGATLVPMNELPARLAELDDHKDKPLVVHCHHGGRSLKVAQYLRAQGFTDVKSLAGGIDAWSRAIDPGVPRY